VFDLWPLIIPLWNLQTFVEFNVEMKKKPRIYIKFSSAVKILNFIFITTGFNGLIGDTILLLVQNIDELKLRSIIL
jgi:hypothetical protein